MYKDNSIMSKIMFIISFIIGRAAGDARDPWGEIQARRDARGNRGRVGQAREPRQLQGGRRAAQGLQMRGLAQRAPRPALTRRLLKPRVGPPPGGLEQASKSTVRVDHEST